MKIDWNGYVFLRGEKYYPAECIEPAADLNVPENENLRRVFIAHILLKKSPAPSFPLSVLFPGDLPVDRASAWVEVPLVLHDGQAGRIYPVLLGLLPFSEIVLEPGEWLLPGAREAAGAALRAVGKGRYGFLLLRRAASPVGGIDGASLGLPLALAAERLVRKKTCSPYIMATGKLDDGGHVLGVGSVGPKHLCAKKKGFSRLFLFPQANERDVPDDSGLDSFPVKTKDEACALYEFMMECGRPDIRFPELKGWKREPQHFFSWLKDMSYNPPLTRCLLNIAESQGWKDSFQGMEAKEDAVCSLFEWREKYVDRMDNDLLRRILSMFPLENVRDMPPETLLKLASLNVTLDHHRGRTDGPWHEASRQCCRDLENKNEESALLALLAGCSIIVNARHNAYRFHEEIPEYLMKSIQEMSDSRRRYHEEKCLGKIYGVLTHHSAFSQDFQGALCHAQESVDFFRDQYNEKRRRIDKVYIYLEINNISEAKKEINHILNYYDADISDIGRIATVEDRYVHAAYARLCRHEPELFRNYPVIDVFEAMARRENCHPWQLWACSCAVLLEDKFPEKSVELLKFSYDMCTSDEMNCTLYPMSLMPLSYLYFFNKAEKDCLLKTEKVLRRLRKLCRNHTLSEAHFDSIINSASPQEVLETVAKNISFFFPFNYS